MQLRGDGQQSDVCESHGNAHLIPAGSRIQACPEPEPEAENGRGESHRS